MQTIEFASTGRMTTRLGFGCSTLMGSIGRRASLAVLEDAYVAGIRHFDVAPMYGYGEAEGCLGEFLSRHRDDVTVATKYGIAPPRNRSLFRMARTIAGPLVRRFPAVKKRLAGAAAAAAQASSGPAEQKSFTVEKARASLEASLNALRTSKIDLWLLHEATANDLSDPELAGYLQDCVARDLIGTFGVGGEASHVPALLAQRPEYCPVVQHEWSVFDPLLPSGTPFRVLYRAVGEPFQILSAMLKENPERLRTWSERTNSNLANPAVLSKLMLKAALAMNPASVLLFSSKQRDRIRANASVADDSTLDAPARHLYELVQAETKKQ